MLEIAALRELLFEKGIITEEEFIARYKRLEHEGERREVITSCIRQSRRDAKR